MLDDDKQAPSVAAWKNEQVVLAPFAGNQGSRLRQRCRLSGGYRAILEG